MLITLYPPFNAYIHSHKTFRLSSIRSVLLQNKKSCIPDRCNEGQCFTILCRANLISNTFFFFFFSAVKKIWWHYLCGLSLTDCVCLLKAVLMEGWLDDLISGWRRRRWRQRRRLKTSHTSLIWIDCTCVSSGLLTPIAVYIKVYNSPWEVFSFSITYWKIEGTREVVENQ